MRPSKGQHGYPSFEPWLVNETNVKTYKEPMLRAFASTNPSNSLHLAKGTISQARNIGAKALPTTVQRHQKNDEGLSEVEQSKPRYAPLGSTAAWTNEWLGKRRR